jgi:hypothetical protein
LGKLFNKQAVYKHLLDSTVYGEGDSVCPHIKKAKVRSD